MKASELIIGGVYVTIGKNPGFIFRNINPPSYTNQPYKYSSTFAKGSLNSIRNDSFEDYRNPTSDELRHFLACEKLNKHVTLKEALEIIPEARPVAFYNLI